MPAVSCVSAYSIFVCVENYIRKVLFHVFSQILGVEPGRDVTIRDGLLLNAGLIVTGDAWVSENHSIAF